MPYTPKRQLNGKPGINWWGVIAVALVTFAGSVLFGRWLGGALISSRKGVALPTQTEIYSVATPAVTVNPPILPQPGSIPRQNVSPSPLQIPPPVVLTPPPEEPNTEESEESPSPSLSSPKVSPALTGPFKVQVGMFVQKKNADDLRKELSMDGYNSVLNPIQRKSQTLYQVYVGPYKERQIADSISKELTQLGYAPFVIGQKEALQATPTSENPPVNPSPAASASPNPSQSDDTTPP